MKWAIGIVAALVCALVAFWYFASGPRAEVAKEKALKQIDSILGETDVQRKEIEIGIKNREKAIDEMSKARIRAQVKSEQTRDDIKQTEKQIAEADEALLKLKGYLASQSPAVIAGKTYTHEQVEEFAKTVLKKREGLVIDLEKKNTSCEQFDSIAKSLKNEEESAKEGQKNLIAQLKDIDADLVLLRERKEAAKIAGDGDKTLADNFEELEKKVTALHEKAKSENRFAGEKWKDLVAKSQDRKKELASAEEIITATKSSGNTLSEIEKVLGNK